MGDVKNLLDIRGASGRSYRFRLVPTGENLPAMSGNFLFVKWRENEPTVVCSGTVDALTGAREHWAEAVKAHEVDALYVRLNLARQTRLAEDADIAALYAPPMHLAEPGEVILPEASEPDPA